MIKSMIQSAAKERKVKNASQLALLTGLHPAVAYKLWAGDAKRIDITTLDKLCAALGCQPGHLHVYKKTRNGKKR